MNAASLLQQCMSNGLRIYIEDGRLQVEGDDELIDQYVPILKTHKNELLAYLEGMENSDAIQPTPPSPIAEHLAHRAMMNLLSQFQMEKVVADVQAHVEAGYATEEIRRVNNVAWHLMTTKDMAFDTAIEVAADWVVHNPEHPDEKKFMDVMTFYMGRNKHEACRDMVADAPAPIERALPVDEHSAVLGNSEAALATAPEAAPESEAAQPATPDQAVPDGMMLLELADNKMMRRMFNADERMAALMAEATLIARNGEFIERALAVTHWMNRAKKAEKALAKLAA